MQNFTTINPYTLEENSLPFEQAADINIKLVELEKQFNLWSKNSLEEKGNWLSSLGKNLSKNKAELAKTITLEMGKPINESLNEVQKCIDCCHHYQHQLHKINDAMVVPKGQYIPVGIVLGIMPWNFPLWQLIRCIVPAICAGNTVLIKPALNTVKTAKKLIELTPKPTIVSSCIVSNSEASELIKHPLIGGVSFTGSVAAGKIIGGLASTYLKPSVLELGGSDPFIIFNDASIPNAIENGVSARFSNNGQTCISAKRFLVQDDIFESVLDQFSNHLEKQLHYANPLSPETTIGPMARLDLKTQVLNQLDRSNIQKDAIKYSYQPPKQQGYFVAPMVIDGRNLAINNPLNTEEVFGPIAVFNSFSSVDDAIEKANDTAFGLGASIWSSSSPRLKQCSNQINCGTIALNQPVHSSFDTPFGGWKASGLGVELGIEGCLSFTRFKAIQQ